MTGRAILLQSQLLMPFTCPTNPKFQAKFPNNCRPAQASRGTMCLSRVLYSRLLSSSSAPLYIKTRAIIRRAAHLPRRVLRQALPPAAIGAAANLSFKQQFELAIQKRNATICTEAIPLFAAALADGTTLSKDDQARAWFWKGLCEYELKQNAAALASFQAVKNMGLSMATSVDVWIKFAGQK